jgi:hypothetical protein
MKANDQSTPGTSVQDAQELEATKSLIQDCGRASDTTRGAGGFFFEYGSPPFNFFGN